MKYNHTAKDINRIKVVLADKKKTNQWLAEQLYKDPATMLKWCTNVSQLSIGIFIEIAKCLDVNSYFDNIVGVSVPCGHIKPIEVVISFSEERFPYVVSKSIHRS